MSNPNKNSGDYVIGIDIGGTNFRIGAVTPGWNCRTPKGSAAGICFNPKLLSRPSPDFCTTTWKSCRTAAARVSVLVSPALWIRENGWSTPVRISQALRTRMWEGCWRRRFTFLYAWNTM